MCLPATGTSTAPTTLFCSLSVAPRSLRWGRKSRGLLREHVCGSHPCSLLCRVSGRGPFLMRRFRWLVEDLEKGFIGVGPISHGHLCTATWARPPGPQAGDKSSDPDPVQGSCRCGSLGGGEGSHPSDRHPCSSHSTANSAQWVLLTRCAASRVHYPLPTQLPANQRL